jgi:hypothetical protein
MWVDYNGNISKLFKQRLGMTPSKYRLMMTGKNENRTKRLPTVRASEVFFVEK